MNLNSTQVTNKVKKKKLNGTQLDIIFIHAVLWILFLVAIGFNTWHWMKGDVTLKIINIEITRVNLSLGFRIDFLSTLIFLMVTLLGATIGRYSLRYLNGEQRQSYFFHYLLFTVLSVSLLVLSSNLLMFFIMWLFTSLGLHKLLLYCPQRKGSISAARKKFIVSRLGDIALIFAIGFTYRVFGTFEFSELFQATHLLSEKTPETSILSYIGLLFVLGAITKSAQFPFHFWLPETMEAPTPVSALMHAGIINAGGFLIIRLSPILQHADIAHLILSGIGSVTAVFGALVMITQNNIKQKLAYSTISQMGMMMFSCGLGAFSLALFHIVAHSFYKAHAFLTTGFLVEEAKKVKFIHTRPQEKFLVIASILGFALIVLGKSLAGGVYVAYFTYTAVLLLGLTQNMSLSGKQFHSMGSQFLGHLAIIFMGAATLCGFIEYILLHKLGGLVPRVWGTNWGHSHQWMTCFVTYFIFVGGLWCTSLLIDPKSPILHKLYVYFWNGGYFSERTSWLFDRI